MSFTVADLSIELIEKLRPLVPRIRARDKRLADQIQRAAISVALNIGEGAYSDPGNRRARFHTAAGSAAETLAAVRTAVAWGIVSRHGRASAPQLPREVAVLTARAAVDPELPLVRYTDRGFRHRLPVRAKSARGPRHHRMQHGPPTAA